MASSSTMVFFAVLTTNAPLRGLPRFTETFTEPLACLETYALMASARFLNACQDLHASMYTAPSGIERISSSHGEPEPPEGADFFAAAGFFVTAFVTGVFLAAAPLEALAFPLVAGIASGARGVCGRVCAGRRRTGVVTYHTKPSKRFEEYFRDVAFGCGVTHQPLSVPSRTPRGAPHGRSRIANQTREICGLVSARPSPLARRFAGRRTDGPDAAGPPSSKPPPRKPTDSLATEPPHVRPAIRANTRRRGVRLSRRLSLFGGLAGVASAASLAEALPATAGEVLDQLQALLSDAEAAIEADPENDALLGQRTFFENQLERTQLNASFVDRLRPRVRSGELPYLQRVAFAVRDDLWEDESTFGKTPWAAASATRALRPGGRKTVAGVVLAFGQESLSADDGGKGGSSSGRRLPVRSRRRWRRRRRHRRRYRTTPSSAAANASKAFESSSLAYVSLSVPYGVRVSRIYEAGGELVCTASGTSTSARRAATRRARACRREAGPDGARRAERPRRRQKRRVFSKPPSARASTPLDQNGYAPKSPPGSKLMTFGEVKETLGILLQPSQAVENPELTRKQGEAFAGVRFVVGGGEPPSPAAGARRAIGNDSQPCAVSVEGYEAWEADVARGARALPFKYNEPPPVAEN